MIQNDIHCRHQQHIHILNNHHVLLSSQNHAVPSSLYSPVANLKCHNHHQ